MKRLPKGAKWSEPHIKQLILEVLHYKDEPQKHLTLKASGVNFGEKEVLRNKDSRFKGHTQTRPLSEIDI